MYAVTLLATVGVHAVYVPLHADQSECQKDTLLAAVKDSLIICDGASVKLISGLARKAELKIKKWIVLPGDAEEHQAASHQRDLVIGEGTDQRTFTSRPTSA